MEFVHSFKRNGDASQWTLSVGLGGSCPQVNGVYVYFAGCGTEQMDCVRLLGVMFPQAKDECPFASRGVATKSCEHTRPRAGYDRMQGHQGLPPIR